MSLKSASLVRFILPAVLCYVVAVTAAAFSQASGPIWQASGVAGAMSLISAGLQDTMPKAWKEFLVFWRKRDRLPGSRAFSVHVHDDPRIPKDFKKKARKWADRDAADQNARWFAMYLTVQNRPPVAHANLRYLGWRDTTAVFAILSILSAVLALFGVVQGRSGLWLIIGCVVAMILCAIAARQSSVALVKNVLSLVAAEKG